MFGLLFSYFLLDESIQILVGISVLPICIGLSMIMIGEIDLTFIGILSILTANISSASKNVFYRILQQNNESGSVSDLSIYTISSFVSILLFIPGYLFKMIIELNINNSNIYSYFELPSYDVLKYLFMGSLF